MSIQVPADFADGQGQTNWLPPLALAAGSGLSSRGRMLLDVCGHDKDVLADFEIGFRTGVVEVDADSIWELVEAGAFELDLTGFIED